MSTPPLGTPAPPAPGPGYYWTGTEWKKSPLPPKPKTPIIAVVIVLAAVAWFAIDATHKSSPSNAAASTPVDTSTDDPAPDSPAPSLSAVGDWYSSGGSGVLDSVTAALSQVGSGDPTDTVAARANCENLGTVVTAALSYPPIPDDTVDEHWTSAMAHYRSSAEDCVSGIDSADVNLVERAATESDEGTAELHEATAALTGS